MNKYLILVFVTITGFTHFVSAQIICASDSLTVYYPLKYNTLDYSGKENHGVWVTKNTGDYRPIETGLIHRNNLANNINLIRIPGKAVAYSRDFTVALKTTLNYNKPILSNEGFLPDSIPNKFGDTAHSSAYLFQYYNQLELLINYTSRRFSVYLQGKVFHIPIPDAYPLSSKTYALTIQLIRKKDTLYFKAAGFEGHTLQAAFPCPEDPLLSEFPFMTLGAGNMDETYKSYSHVNCLPETMPCACHCFNKRQNLGYYAIYSFEFFRKAIDENASKSENAIEVFVEKCEGQPHENYTQAGVYTDRLLNVQGCDSVRTLYFKWQLSSRESENISICEGMSYRAHTKSGVYIDTLKRVRDGCDSIITTTLEVAPQKATNIVGVLCPQSPAFTLNDSTYTQPGQYIQRLPTRFGCDSIINLTVTSKPDTETTIDTLVCPGTTVFGYSRAGLYRDRLKARDGCDSLRVLNLRYSDQLFIPNAFSPNGDGQNDHFMVQGTLGQPGKITRLQVVNRWGTPVYSSQESPFNAPLWDGNWKGQPAPAGVYLYQLVYQCGDKPVTLTGEVNLVR